MNASEVRARLDRIATLGSVLPEGGPECSGDLALGPIRLLRGREGNKKDWGSITLVADADTALIKRFERTEES